MADSQGIASGSTEQEHPSYWSWLLSHHGSNGNGSVNGNGPVNGNASVNGNGLNGHSNGNGALKNGNGSLNGHRPPHRNGRLTKNIPLDGITPTGLARRLGRG